MTKTMRSLSLSLSLILMITALQAQQAVHIILQPVCLKQHDGFFY